MACLLIGGLVTGLILGRTDKRAEDIANDIGRQQSKLEGAVVDSQKGIDSIQGKLDTATDSISGAVDSINNSSRITGELQAGNGRSETAINSSAELVSADADIIDRIRRIVEEAEGTDN